MNNMVRLILYYILAFTVFVFGTHYASTAFAKNKGEYVVILHGIARSSSHMKPLAEYLEQHGYDVINLDYPSTKCKLQDLVKIVRAELVPKLTEDKPVNFVGYSFGGFVIRMYIDKYHPSKLGRVVLLGTPNNGSEVADFLKDNLLFKSFYGPSGQQLTTKNDEVINLLGKVNYELGIIAGNSTIDPISSFIIDGDDDGKVSIGSTKVKGMKDFIIIPTSHTFFPSNKEVHKQVLYFLQNCKFVH